MRITFHQNHLMIIQSLSLLSRWRVPVILNFCQFWVRENFYVIFWNQSQTMWCSFFFVFIIHSSLFKFNTYILIKLLLPHCWMLNIHNLFPVSLQLRHFWRLFVYCWCCKHFSNLPRQYIRLCLSYFHDIDRKLLFINRSVILLLYNLSHSF